MAEAPSFIATAPEMVWLLRMPIGDFMVMKHKPEGEDVEVWGVVAWDTEEEATRVSWRARVVCQVVRCSYGEAVDFVHKAGESVNHLHVVNQGRVTYSAQVVWE